MTVAVPPAANADLSGASEVLAVAAGGGEGGISVEAESITTGVTISEDGLTPVASDTSGVEYVYPGYVPPPHPEPGVVCDAEFEDGSLGNCPAAQVQEEAEDEEAEELDPAEVEAMIQRAFQELPVAPSPITYQPEGDWAAVNLDFVVYTDTERQLLDTEVLGVPLTFRLTPVHWTWDFGDGSPPRGSSTPGAPWPNHTVSHVDSSANDGVTITLATLWSGEYQIAGAGDWFAVDGAVTTTSTAGPIEIVTFDVALVPNDRWNQ